MEVQGDQARFGAIMLPHMDAAYALARYLTRNPVAAEDIVQESYLRAFRGFAGWRGGNAKAWLLQIVRRCFLDTVSRVVPMDYGLEETVTDVVLEGGDPEAIVAERRRAAMLRDAIETLPRPYREAIVLRELEELSYREMATVTDVPIGTVMSRLSRARQMLADRLAPMKDAEVSPDARYAMLDA